MLNRHGLVAGATGTGKTKTLQLMAEQLSAAGVPVFLADIKGDLSGMASPGRDQRPDDAAGDATSGRPGRRTACPTEFLSLGGHGTGTPVRATITSFGPILLSKVLGLNDVQESSLGLIFHFADTGRPAAARPQGPAGRRAVPHLGRGQGRPQGPRRPVRRDGRA